MFGSRPARSLAQTNLPRNLRRVSLFAEALTPHLPQRDRTGFTRARFGRLWSRFQENPRQRSRLAEGVGFTASGPSHITILSLTMLHNILTAEIFTLVMDNHFQDMCPWTNG